MWHAVGVKNSKRDTVKFPKIPAKRAAELRAAISTARDSSGEGLLFELPRRFSDGQRALARTLVGVGVVVGMLAAVAAFIAPDQSGFFVGGMLVPAVIVAGGAAALGFGLDVGVKLHANGTLQREGWGGITQFDVKKYPRVTVAENKPLDLSQPID